MGMMQQIRDEARIEGRTEGRIEGLVDGIELLLRHRFGEDGLSVLAEIRQVKDVALLYRVHDSLMTVQSVAELRRIYARQQKPQRE